MRIWQSWVGRKTEDRLLKKRKDEDSDSHSENDSDKSVIHEMMLVADAITCNDAEKKAGVEAQHNDLQIDETVWLDILESEPQAPDIEEPQVKAAITGVAELTMPALDENHNEEPIDETMMLDIFEHEPLRPDENNSAERTDDTILTSAFLCRATTANSDLPPEIYVNIGIEEKFSIGRFDAVVGKKQSDFEFGKNTKAVSRRHAVIGLSEDGYYITDIGSTAGIYINKSRIAPEKPCKISDGDLVSFGNTGIDYTWECKKRGDNSE